MTKTKLTKPISLEELQNASYVRVEYTAPNKHSVVLYKALKEEGYVKRIEYKKENGKWAIARTSNWVHEGSARYILGKVLTNIGVSHPYWNTYLIRAGTRKAVREVKARAAPSKRDIQRLAMLPGKRISRTGKTYYETRVNRSDTEEERKTHGVKTIAGIRAAIKPYENKIRELDYEWLYSINKYGNLDYHKTDHHPSSVSCGDMPENLAAVTHNHPSSSPFSSADLATAVRQNVGEMRIASKYYDYHIRSKDGDWGYHKSRYKNRERYGEVVAHNYTKALQELDSKYYKIFNAEVEKRIKAIPGTATMFQLDQIKKETSRDVGRIQMHEAWLKFAQENNIEYTRTARKGVKPWQLPKS